MPRIRVNLDAATQALLEQAAAASGMSKSHWVAKIIRNHFSPRWPQDCLAAAGQFADFPLRADDPAALPPDLPRPGS